MDPKRRQSQKHLEDIRAILDISSKDIDKAGIEDWVKHLQLSEEWSAVNTEKMTSAQALAADREDDLESFMLPSKDSK
ncbi:MAG: hypothetical protein HY540_06915 [Deltaproteobacteria bacterium]|nr:hypothetical protein [Deltaproteobacteria bacterium]